MVKIGILGIGFVGSAIKKSFDLNGIETIGYDKYKNIGTFSECLDTDMVFLCLPTCFDDEKREYDKSSIIEVCEDLNRNSYNGLIIIKSTVEPKTTQNLADRFPKLKLVHNPEFLTAKTAFFDFHNQTHVVLGKSQNVSDEDINELERFYKKYYSDADISVCTSTESESMKIYVNCFYSVKIQFFNELYLLCQENDCSFDKVKDLMLKNKWINPMHTKVPGTDGKLSYGGGCFTKDTRALLESMRRADTPSKVLDACIRERDEMRNDHSNIAKFTSRGDLSETINLLNKEDSFNEEDLCEKNEKGSFVLRRNGNIIKQN